MREEDDAEEANMQSRAAADTSARSTLSDSPQTAANAEHNRVEGGSDGEGG